MSISSRSEEDSRGVPPPVTLKEIDELLSKVFHIYAYCGYILMLNLQQQQNYYY